jgi:hypothetical protein
LVPTGCAFANATFRDAILLDLALNYVRGADQLRRCRRPQLKFSGASSKRILKLTDQHKQQIMDAVLRNAKVQE